MEEMKSKLISTVEAGKMLGVSNVTVRAYYQQGMLQGRQFGEKKHIKIDVESVNKLLKK